VVQDKKIPYPVGCGIGAGHQHGGLRALPIGRLLRCGRSANRNNLYDRLRAPTFRNLVGVLTESVSSADGGVPLKFPGSL
jgi:hypothetical protein